MHDALLVLLGKFGGFLDACTCQTLLCGVVDQHTLTQGGAERVDGQDFTLGEFFQQFLGGDAARAEGAAETGGEAEVEHVKTAL